MNSPRIPFFMRHALLATAVASLFSAFAARAQEEKAEEEKKERVQYQLVLPDEKTPETVKPEEHNPFESQSDIQSRTGDGNTEENRVRDILVKLPVKGISRRPDGRLRVLLGDIDLTVGEYVPQVLPDQMVELKVKSITHEYIELAWQDKEVVGLPPKSMVIPIDIEPSVTVKMKGYEGTQAAPSTKIRRSGLGGIMRNGKPIATQPAQPEPPPVGTTRPAYGIQVNNTPPSAPRTPGAAPAAPPAAMPVGTPGAAPAPGTPAKEAPPAATPPPPANPGVESMMRMLFGNQPEANK